MVLTSENLREIEEHLVEILPALLERNPQTVLVIEGILAQLFPRRDEFARLLDEFQTLRQEMHTEFTNVRSEMKSGFANVRTEMQVGFSRVDQEITEMKGDILSLKRGFAKVEHTQEMMLKRMDGQESWLRMTIGDLRNEKGETWEDLFAAGLRYGLGDPDIVAESIRLRQPLVDHKGQIFPKGFATEIDLVARSHELIVFEVKATSKVGDVDMFALKVQLLRLQNPDSHVRGVLITLGASDAIQQRCLEQNLELVR